jgi:hypothetical protein
MAEKKIIYINKLLKKGTKEKIKIVILPYLK